MMRDSYVNRQQNPPVLESMEIVVALVLMAVCWFSWYVARERFFFTNRQIAELACYLALGGLAIAGSAILIATARSRREKQWPHPPMVISRKRDEQFTAEAWKQDAVVLGYDIHGKPWYWPDRVRVMQGIVLGMTGSGKTTLLKNIITQDMARVVGTPKDPHRLPMVIFDGKGDLEFFYDLLPARSPCRTIASATSPESRAPRYLCPVQPVLLQRRGLHGCRQHGLRLLQPA